MPQLKTETYASQVFWLVVAFIILYLLNSRVGLPAVGAVLEARRERIDGDLDQAAALKTQAEQVRAEFEKALAAADAEAKRALGEATEAVKAQTAQRQAEMTAQLDVRLREAEQSIAQAKQAALASVRDVAMDITAAAAAKVGGIQPDPQAAAGAVDAAMRERG
jgi:F-type H+-transporting ATPase subunit b